MRKKSARIIIMSCLVWLAANYSSFAETEFVQTNGITLSVFSNMQRGISVDKVQQLLRSPGKHQFSCLHEDREYLCLYFLFDEPRAGFYLIFTNNHLKAVVVPLKSEFERVPFKGHFRDIPKPIDSEVRMQSVLASKDLSKIEIEDQFRNAPRKGKESSNVLPAFVIAAPFWALKAGKIHKDYLRNSEFAEKFDPLKVKMGASAENLNGIFGTPFRVAKISPSQIIQVYGSDVPLLINAADRFSWVAVAFEDGKAVRVFSDIFFDKRLKETK